jgi:putative transposase
VSRRWHVRSDPKADPPRPKPDRPVYEVPVPSPRTQPHPDLPAHTHVRTVSTAGTIGLDSITYMVDAQRAFQQVLVVRDCDTIIITDLQGEVLAEHTRPAPAIKYVGNGRPRGPRPKTGKPSPKS